jgi:hypothetical protein
LIDKNFAETLLASVTGLVQLATAQAGKPPTKEAKEGA